MRNTAINHLYKLAKNNKNVVLLVGDLGFGVVDIFKNELPEQFFNIGICEQNMASVATGLALEGKIVYTYSIANFPTLRCLEQIRNDVAYHNANVNIIAVGCGFSYGALGMSHHTTEDISIMRSIPNINILSPCSVEETIACIDYTYNIETPCYIRLDKTASCSSKDNIDFKDILNGQKIKNGKDICILATGTIISEALKAIDILEKKDIYPALYSIPCIKPIDTILIENCLKKYGYIFTLEENNIIGGLGSAVSEFIAESNYKVKFKRIGLNDTFPSVVGDKSFLREYYKISGINIANIITEAVGNK